MSKVYSMAQFSEALKKLSKSVRGEVLAKAAMAGGQVIEAYAKINVNSTFKNGIGNLEDSIQTTLDSSSGDRAEVSVGPTAIYGRIQELGGTVKPLVAKKLWWVGEDGNLRSAYSVTLPARPYMAPAANDNEDAIWQAVGENLRIEIEGAI